MKTWLAMNASSKPIWGAENSKIVIGGGRNNQLLKSQITSTKSHRSFFWFQVSRCQKTEDRGFRNSGLNDIENASLNLEPRFCMLLTPNTRHLKPQH